MGATEALLLAGSLIAVGAFWISPGGTGQGVVAGLTAATLLALAPLSGVWLLLIIAMTPPLMHLGERSRRRGAVAFAWTVVLVLLLLVSRSLESRAADTVTLVGAAYFTLRHIHVLMEWWLGRMPIPSIAAYARYHLFLPVLIAGPIHRMPHFERQCARRRWDPAEFFSGAERALFGAFLAVVVGSFAFAHLSQRLAPHLVGLSPFLREWVLSAVDWVRLYIQFSGFTDLALGLSLMMGLRLEENFNRPWQARNLIDFWNRWHMTLSHWCRDYVYVPIAARFRAPLAGLGAAMLAIGIWHGTSAYYVLWALWQALGIVLARLIRNRRRPAADERRGIASALVAPVVILAWLSAARPVILTLFGGLAS